MKKYQEIEIKVRDGKSRCYQPINTSKRPKPIGRTVVHDSYQPLTPPKKPVTTEKKKTNK